MVTDAKYGRFITNDTTYPSFYMNAFSTAGKSAILPTRIDIEAGNASAWGGAYGNKGAGYSVADKVYAISAADAGSSKYFADNAGRKTVGTPYAKTAAGSMTGGVLADTGGYSKWWLGSANATAGNAGTVDAGGAVGSGSVSDTTSGARPAINLDPSKIVLTAASQTGSTPTLNTDLSSAAATASGAAPTSFSTSYTAGASFRVFARGGNGALNAQLGRAAGSADAVVRYSSATYEKDNTFLAGMLINKTTKQKYAARFAPTADIGYGAVNIKLPADAGTHPENYVLYVWNENELTKKTSDMVMFDSLVSDHTPPEVLTAVPNPNDGLWTKSKTIKATAFDSETGVMKLFWSDKASGAATGTEGFVFDALTNTWECAPIDKSGTYYVYAVDNAGIVSPNGFKVIVPNVDHTAPTGGISVKDNAGLGWEWLEKFIEVITFNNYSKDNKTVTLTSADEAGGSGVKSVKYMLAAAGLSKAEIAADTVVWTAYNDLLKPVLKPNDKYIVYARIDDVAGNIKYLSSDGMVFDNLVPLTGGVSTIITTPAVVNGYMTENNANYSIEATGIADMVSTGDVSKLPNVESGVKNVYLMPTAEETDTAKAIYELTKLGDKYVSTTMARPDTSFTGYVKALDNAGNWSTAATGIKTEIKVDITAPIFGELWQEPQIGANKQLGTFVSDAVGESGIAQVWLAATADEPYSDAKKLTESPGEKGRYGITIPMPSVETTYYIIAVDGVGHKSVTNAFTVGGVDREPPVIGKISTVGANEVSAIVTDAKSGMGVVYLATTSTATSGVPMRRIGHTSEYVSSSLAAAGNYFVVAYDRAGNRSVKAYTTAGLDVTLPTGTAKQSPDGMAASKQLSARFTDPNGAAGELVSGINPLRVYYSAAQNASETAAILMSVQPDGGFLSGPLTQTGNYYVFAYDKAGNRSADVQVAVNGVTGTESQPVDPITPEEISGYYQGGGTGAAMDSTKALVWMGTTPTLFRTLGTGSDLMLITEHAQGTAAFGNSKEYSSSTLKGVMNTFAGNLGSIPGLRTVDLTDVGVTAQSVYPLEYTSGAGIMNTSYFPQSDASRMAGQIETPTSGVNWWTRTGHASSSRAWLVMGANGVPQSYMPSSMQGYRPALSLNATDAIYVAAGDNGAAPTPTGTLVRTMGAFKSVDEGTARIGNAGAPISNAQTFRLFSRNNTNASLGTKTQVTAATGTQLKLDYKGASFGADNFLGVMLVNKTTHEKWTARVGNIGAATGQQIITIPESAMNADYLLYVWNENEAGKNACTPVMFNMNGIRPLDQPKVMSVTQTPAEWSNAATPKTVTAQVTFGAGALNKKVEIAQNADGTGARYQMPVQPNGSYMTTEVKTGGVWYVFATDVTDNVASTMPVKITIDTAPPTAEHVKLGHTNAIEAEFKDIESGVAKAWWSANADGSAAVEMTLTNGVYMTPVLTEPQTYYVFAEDIVGNKTAVMPVDATLFYDTTAPDIGNVLFEDLGTGTTRVSFTAEDIAKGKEPAVGVKLMQWKKGTGGTYADVTKNTAYADGNHYYFEIPTAEAFGTEYYLRAEDWASNVNEIRAMDQKGTISVSAPAKMLFAVYPNVLGQQFFSPEYEVKNNSETLKTRVDVVDFRTAKNADGSANEFTLAAQGTAFEQNAKQISLYMQPGAVPGAFGAFGKYNLMPDVLTYDKGLTLGSLTPKTVGGTATEQGKYTFAGDIPSYDLLKLKDITMRAGFSMTMRFEKDNVG
ncbi:MAG: DUF6273 domain-containing protein [Christensenella sp.]